MKKLLLLFFLCLSIKYYAQTEVTQLSASSYVSYNKYLIKVNPAVSINVSSVSNYMKRICAADLVSFNANSGYFEVLTKKVLEQNIIDGKLQKNATPMVDYIFFGEVKIATSAASNDISTE